MYGCVVFIVVVVEGVNYTNDSRGCASDSNNVEVVIFRW